jgi:hypothetical protein
LEQDVLSEAPRGPQAAELPIDGAHIGEEDNEEVIELDEASLAEDSEGNAVNDNTQDKDVDMHFPVSASDTPALTLLFTGIPPLSEGRCLASTAEPRFKSKYKVARSVLKRNAAGHTLSSAGQTSQTATPLKARRHSRPDSCLCPDGVMRGRIVRGWFGLSVTTCLTDPATTCSRQS